MSCNVFCVGLSRKELADIRRRILVLRRQNNVARRRIIDREVRIVALKHKLEEATKPLTPRVRR